MIEAVLAEDAESVELSERRSDRMSPGDVAVASEDVAPDAVVSLAVEISESV